jgi:integrase
MSVRVRVAPAREVKGQPWAAKYPEKANEPWLVWMVDGKRKREHIGPDTPEAWEQAHREAEELRRCLTQRAGNPNARVRAETVREAAQHYLDKGMKGNAESTKAARRQQLRRLCDAIGSVPLDRLTAGHVTKWWAEFVDGGGRDYRTGMGHVEALNLVVRYAQFRSTADIINPVPEARARIKDRYKRTKALRGRDQKNRRPLTAAECQALLAADMRLDTRVFITLLLDGGLRLGEALALTFDDVQERVLRIHRSVDIPGNVGPTKTGEERQVHLSQRLRGLLREWRMARGRPAGHIRILGRRGRLYYRRQLRATAEAAGITHDVRPKDLRDTYASQLLSRGTQLAYICKQLGHEHVTTTARYYGTYAESGYSERLDLGEGEVPADLVSRLATTLPPSATTTEKAKR